MCPFISSPSAHVRDVNILLQSPGPSRMQSYHSLKTVLASYNAEPGRDYVMKMCMEWPLRPIAKDLLGGEPNDGKVCDSNNNRMKLPLLGEI